MTDHAPPNTARRGTASTPASPPDTVAVIGGGWAGMAAALELVESGRHVHVLEAAPVLGGRARRVARAHPSVAGELDNGQHLLLGAYRHTLDLIRRAGVDPERALLRLPLQMAYPDGWQLQAPHLPAPWHLLAMGLSARGPGWGERVALARTLAALRRGERANGASAAETVADWLMHTPATLRNRLWFPLCVAAMNTPPEQADAAVFRRLLRDSVLAARSDSDMLVPRHDLSRLFPEAAAQAVRAAGGTVSTGTPVQRIAPRPHGGWDIHTGAGILPVAQLVLATAPRQAARLLGGCELPAVAPLVSTLEGFGYAPIVTVYLNVGGLRLPRPFLALDSDADAPGQFVFDRAALAGDPTASLAGRDNVWSVVISAADDAASLPQAELASRVRQQLAIQLRPLLADAARLVDARGEFVIAERLATFRCVPGLARPDNDTGVAGLVLAGDYTAGPYPATIEGATVSGSAAAALLLRETAGQAVH